MFQIKFQSSGFAFQLDFSGSVAQSLKEMPMEIREMFIRNVENLLKASLCLVSGIILVPIIAPSVFPKAFEALHDVTVGAQEKMHKAQKDEMEFVANGKTSSADN